MSKNASQTVVVCQKNSPSTNITLVTLQIRNNKISGLREKNEECIQWICKIDVQVDFNDIRK